MLACARHLDYPFIQLVSRASLDPFSSSLSIDPPLTLLIQGAIMAAFSLKAAVLLTFVAVATAGK